MFVVLVDLVISGDYKWGSEWMELKIEFELCLEGIIKKIVNNVCQTQQRLYNFYINTCLQWFDDHCINWLLVALVKPTTFIMDSIAVIFSRTGFSYVH